MTLIIYAFSSTSNHATNPRPATFPLIAELCPLCSCSTSLDHFGASIHSVLRNFGAQPACGRSLRAAPQLRRPLARGGLRPVLALRLRASVVSPRIVALFPLGSALLISGGGSSLSRAAVWPARRVRPSHLSFAAVAHLVVGRRPRSWRPRGGAATAAISRTTLDRPRLARRTLV